MLDKYKKAKKLASKVASLALVISVSLLATSCSLTDSNKSYSIPKDIEVVIEKACNRIIEEVPNPTISAVGGEWTICALAKSDYNVSDSYFDLYYDNVRAMVKSKSGVLSEDRYTEYEKLIIALSMIGKDAKNVEGYDLTKYMDDYDVVTAQGINAVWYALIASELSDSKLENKDKYIDLVLESIEGGEYSGSGLSDYIAIGLQALSFFDDRDEVKRAIAYGIELLSDYQLEDGSLGNCESTAMCILALTMNGVDALGDERFIKEGKTLGDGLMTFYVGSGGFCHTLDLPEMDIMATEQALMSLDSILLLDKGERFYS